MFVLNAVFFALAVISSAKASYSDEGKLSCQPFETQCALGCCPYPNAVCCADGYECCQNGYTCIPIIGICIGLNKENLTLSSQETAKFGNQVAYCPPGTTTCGSGCCPLPSAVCCSDGTHCCPNGYTCDLAKGACTRGSYMVPFLQKAMPKSYAALPHSAREDMLKTCPDGLQRCGQTENCCINDEGNWDCCSKV